MKEKIREGYKEHFFTVFMVAFSLQVVFLLVAIFLRFSNFYVMTILGFLVVSIYITGKDNTKDKQKKWLTIILQISLSLLVISLVNHGIIRISENMSEEKRKAFAGLSLLISVFSVFAAIAFFKRDDVQKTFKNLEENSLADSLKKKDDEPGVGDVLLCTSISTEKPVYLPVKDRFLHMLVLGPTGSGKTSQTIIPMLLQDVQNYEAGITVIEPKGDLAEKIFAMAEHFGRPAIYFNPILPDCPYFNPLVGIESDVIENMSTTFKMLNPDSPQFFLDMNDNLVRNALKVLKRTLGDNATLIDMHRLISNSNNEGKKMVQNFLRIVPETKEMLAENQDIGSYFLNDYFAEKSKTYEHCSGLRSQVAKITSNKYLRKVLNPPPGKNDMDFDHHLESGGIIVIATAQGTLRDLGRYLGFFIILQFQASVFRRPGNEDTRRHHFLYIDEFQVYANPGFADMLTQGRSYRVASHLATQNRALIGMGQGQAGKDFIELVSTNARNVIIYPGGNIQDADYYSKQFGTIIEKRTDVGISRKKWNPMLGLPDLSQPTESIREVEEEKQRFTPSDIIYRPFGQITFMIIKNNTLQLPDVGEIAYIPYELNKKLDKRIAEYNKEQEEKAKNMKTGTPINQKEEDVVDMDNIIKEIQPSSPSTNYVVQEPPHSTPSSFIGEEIVESKIEGVDSSRMKGFGEVFSTNNASKPMDFFGKKTETRSGIDNQKKVLERGRNEDNINLKGKVMEDVAVQIEPREYERSYDYTPEQYGDNHESNQSDFTSDIVDLNRIHSDDDFFF